MSDANAEDFWRGTAAYNAGDWDAALSDVDPEVVFDLTRAAPDGQTYRGHEGVRDFWGMLREVFGDYRVDPQEVFECGDRLFTRIRMSGSGKASGAVTEDVLYQVLTIHQGKVMRADFFRERGQALEAAGLSE